MAPVFFWRVTAWLSTIVVALVVALAVPVAQLRISAVLKTCCCPDPDHCHCPDHQPDPSPQTSMQACHNAETVLVTAELAAFHPPVAFLTAAPVRARVAIEHTIPAPHPAPPPLRPDAPS